MFSSNNNIKNNITHYYDDIVDEYDNLYHGSYAIVNWIGYNDITYNKIVEISVMTNGTRTFRPGIMRLMKDPYFKKLLSPIPQ